MGIGERSRALTSTTGSARANLREGLSRDGGGRGGSLSELRQTGKGCCPHPLPSLRLRLQQKEDHPASDAHH